MFIHPFQCHFHLALFLHKCLIYHNMMWTDVAEKDHPHLLPSHVATHLGYRWGLLQPVAGECHYSTKHHLPENIIHGFLHIHHCDTNGVGTNLYFNIRYINTGMST